MKTNDEYINYEFIKNLLRIKRKFFNYTWDKEVNAIYVYTSNPFDGIRHPKKGFMINGDVSIDFDSNHNIIGVEIILSDDDSLLKEELNS